MTKYGLTLSTSHPYLRAVPTAGAPRVRRMSEREAEAAVVLLVRGMGEGDILEGLGKLQMLQALDSMRYDWLAVLEANLPDLPAGRGSEIYRADAKKPPNLASAAPSSRHSCRESAYAASRSDDGRVEEGAGCRLGASAKVSSLPAA